MITIIIIILPILVVGTSVGILLLLRRRVRQGNPRLRGQGGAKGETSEDGKNQMLLKDIQAYLNIKDTESEVSSETEVPAYNEGENDPTPIYQKLNARKPKVSGSRSDGAIGHLPLRKQRGSKVGEVNRKTKSSATEGNRKTKSSVSEANIDELDDVVEEVTQIIHKLEDTLEDREGRVNQTDTEGDMSQLNETTPEYQQQSEDYENEKSQKLLEDIQTDTEISQLKEDSEKAVHQVQDTTESQSETAPELEKYEDDDISALAEKLTRLVDEYEETYQKLRQIIANKQKQLEEASKYINIQTEKLGKLTANNEDAFASPTLPIAPPSDLDSDLTLEINDDSQFRKPKVSGSRSDGASVNEVNIDEVQEAKHEVVSKLAEQGIDRIQIAQQTELPVGEIDLLLSLKESAMLSNNTESEE